MRESTYHVGDRVRVREWDDMAAEFHNHSPSAIDVGPCLFTRRMRGLCGLEFEIRDVETYDDTFQYGFGVSVFLNTDIGTYWIITEQMLEPVDDADDASDYAMPDGFLSVLGVSSQN